MTLYGFVCMFCVTRRPSGRLEVVQLMRMMDEMLVKAGVDQQSEELTELSQVRQTDNTFRSVLHQAFVLLLHRSGYYVHDFLPCVLFQCVTFCW